MNPIEPVLLSFWKDVQDLRVLWQILIVALSLGLAAWWARSAHPSANGPDAPGPAQAAWDSVLFPLSALILTLTGRWILGHFQPVGLLNLAVPLLIALLIVRVTLHMLQHVIAPGTMLASLARAVFWLVWLGFALYVTGFAKDLVDYLDDIGVSLGTRRISILVVLQSVTILAGALLLSLWLGHVVENRVMASDANLNVRVMLSKVLRPLLVLIAILIALPMIGIDLTALSVFGGAIGVGLGFGLQKIASNYVSGFIILLDRSVNMGDFLTIEKHSGQLTKMTARYVVIKAADGTEVIIPNETVITSTVVNHSYSDKSTRLAIPIQIGYESDLEAAMRLMIEAARAHSRVIAAPPPKVLITQFADSGINLELGVWVVDPEEGRANLRSDIYQVVWKSFRTHGISIPYPHRDVRLFDATHKTQAVDGT